MADGKTKDDWKSTIFLKMNLLYFYMRGVVISSVSPHLLPNLKHLSDSPQLMQNLHHLRVSPIYCWTYTTSVSSPQLLLNIWQLSVSPQLLQNLHHISVSHTYCWTYTTSESSPLTAEPRPRQCLLHLLLNLHHLSVSPHLLLNLHHLSVSPHLLLNIHHLRVFPTYCWTYTTSVSPPLTAEPTPPQCLPPLTAEHAPPLKLCVCGRTAAWEGRHITWCGQGSRTLMIAHLLHFREGAAWGNHHEGLCSSCLPITTGLCAHRTGHGQGWVP